MKQTEEPLSILNEDRLMFGAGDPTTGLQYPTMEEYKRMQNGNAAGSMGQAQSIPHPDDMPAFIPGEMSVTQSQMKNHALLSGIPMEGESVRKQPKPDPMFAGIAVETSTRPVTQAPIKKAQAAPGNPAAEMLSNLIRNAKKEPKRIKLDLTVNLPVKNFLDILEDKFLEKNRKLVFQEMMSLIDKEEMLNQIKEYIEKFYAIQPKRPKKNAKAVKSDKDGHVEEVVAGDTE